MIEVFCDENKSGACWTFLKVRFDQLLFGLYFASNPDQIWRPITAFLTFGIIFLLLFEKTPFKKWLLILYYSRLILFFYNIVYGGYFGIPVSDTTQWGGFLLTFALAFVGIVSRSCR